VDKTTKEKITHKWKKQGDEGKIEKTFSPESKTVIFFNSPAKKPLTKSFEMIY